MAEKRKGSDQVVSTSEHVNSEAHLCVIQEMSPAGLETTDRVQELILALEPSTPAKRRATCTATVVDEKASEDSNRDVLVASAEALAATVAAAPAPCTGAGAGVGQLQPTSRTLSNGHVHVATSASHPYALFLNDAEFNAIWEVPRDKKGKVLSKWYWQHCRVCVNAPPQGMFGKRPVKKTTVFCLLCKEAQKFTYDGSSTSRVRDHLRQEHGFDAEGKSATQRSGKEDKISKLPVMKREDQLRETAFIVRCLALAKIPPSKIATYGLHQLLTRHIEGYRVPVPLTVKRTIRRLDEADTAEKACILKNVSYLAFSTGELIANAVKRCTLTCSSTDGWTKKGTKFIGTNGSYVDFASGTLVSFPMGRAGWPPSSRDGLICWCIARCDDPNR